MFCTKWKHPERKQKNSFIFTCLNYKKLKKMNVSRIYFGSLNFEGVQVRKKTLSNIFTQQKATSLTVFFKSFILTSNSSLEILVFDEGQRMHKTTS